MEEYKSMAGTDKKYFGNDNFRIRKGDGGTVRLHLPRTNLRNRDGYVAIDFDAQTFRDALMASGIVTGVKEVTETVMVPTEITTKKLV